MTGGDSDESSRKTASRLASVILHAETATLTGLDHFGPDQTGPEQVSRAIIDFFTK